LNLGPSGYEPFTRGNAKLAKLANALILLGKMRKTTPLKLQACITFVTPATPPTLNTLPKPKSQTSDLCPCSQAAQTKAARSVLGKQEAAGVVVSTIYQLRLAKRMPAE
jgi:hypothetical protein